MEIHLKNNRCGRLWTDAQARRLHLGFHPFTRIIWAAIVSLGAPTNAGLVGREIGHFIGSVENLANPLRSRFDKSRRKSCSLGLMSGVRHRVPPIPAYCLRSVRSDLLHRQDIEPTQFLHWIERHAGRRGLPHQLHIVRGKAVSSIDQVREAAFDREDLI
jgi:hypothetical protein